MDTEELIARAEASLEGVTPGPWRYDRTNGSPTTGQHMIAGGLPGYLAEVRDCGSGDVFGNARFIAASRQLVPDLIAALRAERAARERAEALVAAAYRDAAEPLRQFFLTASLGSADYVRGQENLALDARRAILARAPTDAQAALDRKLKQAADEALERAAVKAEDTDGYRYPFVAAAIRAMKGGAE